MKLIGLEEFIYILFREASDVSCLNKVWKFRYDADKKVNVGELTLHLSHVSGMYAKNAIFDLNGKVKVVMGNDHSTTFELEFKEGWSPQDTWVYSIKDKLKHYSKLFSLGKLNTPERNLFDLFKLDIASATLKETRCNDVILVKTVQWVEKDSFAEKLFDVMLRVVHTGGIISTIERTPSMLVEWRTTNPEDTRVLFESLTPIQQPRPITVPDC